MSRGDTVSLLVSKGPRPVARVMPKLLGRPLDQARLLAKQAQEWSQDAAAKARVLEQRVADATLQRSQLDELVESLSRSRDENVVADVEAGLRVALQQSAITGSVEPLVTALKAADERLERANQPRLDAVRRVDVHQRGLALGPT